MSSLAPEELAILRGARLLALDVDGVLTRGQVVYQEKEELQHFDVQDGQGLVWLRDAGVQIAWITGRGGAATRRRATELRIPELHIGVTRKAVVLEEVQKRAKISIEETVAMGDDLPDLALASRAGFFAAPRNARPEVAARARLVTAAEGGRGAVRELAEQILKAKGLWSSLLARYSP
jgi:3-deoxy-D-manno-octulosonate 8-phosphate phosphatase (KDO 8-P phosphatase)